MWLLTQESLARDLLSIKSKAHQQISEQVALLSLTAELLKALLYAIIWKLHCQGCAPQLWPQPRGGALLQYFAACCNGALLYTCLLGCQAVLPVPRVQHIVHPYLHSRMQSHHMACHECRLVAHILAYNTCHMQASLMIWHVTAVSCKRAFDASARCATVY